VKTSIKDGYKNLPLASITTQFLGIFISFPDLITSPSRINNVPFSIILSSEI
jgi:hypothetical protein